jgi:hypothetical protein
MSHHIADQVIPSYVSCNESTIDQVQEIWTEFDASLEQSTGIEPYLLTHTSSDQSEQSTRNSAITPTELFWECVPETSVALKQLGDDVLWPMLRSDSYQQQPQQNVLLEHRAIQQSAEELHSTDELVAAHYIEATGDTRQPVINPRPLPRKRGRPRIHFPPSEVRNGNISRSQHSTSRQYHLEKNRIAAAKCRERSKEHVGELVARASDLSSKNNILKADETTLRDQVLNLKNEVLRHAVCGSWAIDAYVSRCAGDILGVQVPSVQTPASRRDSAQMQFFHGSTKLAKNAACKTISGSHIGEGSMESSTESDDYDSLRLCNMYGDT